jgi:copper(I)-binding protein
MKRLPLIIPLLLLVLILAACAPAGQEVKVGSISIVSPWIMAAESGGNTAGFMLLKNSGGEPDRLVKAEYADAMATEIHEMKMTNDVMEMSPVEGVDIPAKGEAELKSGGYHVMIMGLMKTLTAGDKVSVTLTFEKAGSVTVEMEVRNP